MTDTDRIATDAAWRAAETELRKTRQTIIDLRFALNTEAAVLAAVSEQLDAANRSLAVYKVIAWVGFAIALLGAVARNL